ncbi:phosphoribosylanthranilate isomerase [Limosilactobacillus sp. RRLNB_1_1]|uniref:N-(5'-phosphoribosyl)anthranilate isomerase n=1 Tax=Limosilactobacillus albertensis TaxID=2759752 RepID=A0A7W3Y878_9LACO|nr:phosphoribosylanthranilate isomerase [Limosilactobacillus albertensis]MBB1069715.1 phosphoribosylanthranilate isomerase [Limosilactobacillus albertensis]MCD7117823.1 phosphoribosylanthranilate isomerase [Limosilactobacillus albertensis]MCD7128467.1 phosphoribosylanthranilate isomerase [Limosilactobacillus albertensis]
MIKQLYSIIQLDEAIKTMEAGADNIGLVPMQKGGVPAHRVPLYRVDQIHEECRKRGVNMVLIMLTNDPEEMLDLAHRLQPEILHVAGDEYTADEEFAKRLKELAPNTELMQAVLVDGKGAIDRAKKVDPFVDYILLDSGLAADTGIGASGKTHDWSIDAQIVKEVNAKVIEAGGMGPDNVADAIKEIRPYGVDSLTKTSIKYDHGNMEKDIPKVKAFCEAADKAAAELGL